MRKNRSTECILEVVLLIAALTVTTLAENSVGIYNARLQQVTTSSTLKWTSLTTDPVVAYTHENGKKKKYKLKRM